MYSIIYYPKILKKNLHITIFVTKVARTISDLDASENIQNDHLAEAINYLSLDRENWGN